jgi:hypothetical protein
MGRTILALVCGLATAWGIIVIDKLIAFGGWESTGRAIGFMSREELITYISTRPMAFNVTLLIGSILGGLFGGLVVTGMSRREHAGISMSVVLGVFLILGGLVNYFVLLPGSPAWLVGATLISYIPMSVIGNKLA